MAGRIRLGDRHEAASPDVPRDEDAAVGFHLSAGFV